MSDLISREKAKEILTDLSIYYDRKIHAPMISNGIDFAAQKLNDVPTVDAIPVVKCGECKFSEQFFGPDDIYCPIMDCYPNNDFYCGAGEKEEDNRG
ncbi:MAG: hypothetical protein WC900_07555 [Oscillospiraceae bacterium]